MKENILPAIRNMRDLERLTKTNYKACVLLDMHIGHLKSIMGLLKQYNIECYIHIDLIKGLSHDEFACEDSTKDAFNLGFDGKSLVHPVQIEYINDIFIGLKILEITYGD